MKNRLILEGDTLCKREIHSYYGFYTHFDAYPKGTFTLIGKDELRGMGRVLGSLR